VFLLAFRLLPYSARRRWRDIFYTHVEPDDSVKYYTEDGKKINIVDLYRIPKSRNSQPKATNNNNNVEAEDTKSKGVDNGAYIVEKL